MRQKGTIDKDGTEIEVEGVGVCYATRFASNCGGYQWRIKHGRFSVLGDFSTDNNRALQSAFKKLKIRFKLK